METGRTAGVLCKNGDLHLSHCVQAQTLKAIGLFLVCSDMI